MLYRFKECMSRKQCSEMPPGAFLYRIDLLVEFQPDTPEVLDRTSFSNRLIHCGMGQQALLTLRSAIGPRGRQPRPRS